MTRTKSSASFSSNDKFAVYSDDGTLHVWDSASGKEKIHFTPTSHLTATFTCLSWKIRQHQKQSHQVRKRKKLKSDDDAFTFEYIALGTATGDVLIFDSTSGEISTKLTEGHTDQVNDICWNSDGSTLYSCSKDQHIIEWQPSSTIHKSKWKADKREVHSIKLLPQSKAILSAGKLIKLWDVKTKELLRKFPGHSSPVISLTYVEPVTPLSSQDATALETVDGLYFVSTALDERSLSAWQIKSSKQKKSALCSFSLPSEPRQTIVFSPTKNDDTVHILCITQDHEAVLFSHVLNGPMQKPLRPKVKIRICTEEAEPLSILSSTFHESSTSGEVVLLIAYGSTAKVVFEKINLSEHSNDDVVLIRKDPTVTFVSVEDEKLKIKIPPKRKDEISAIVPGAAEHIGGKNLRDANRKRKKFPSIGESQMTMEDRMTALSMDSAATPDGPGKSKAVCADSFSVLLSQGLQSNDRDVLNQVLQHGSDTLIKNTVQQLPLPYIIPLMKELTHRLHGSPEKCLIFVKWLRSTLEQHASYLMTFPDVSSLLNDLYQLMSVRTQTHGRLSRLEGKLDLIMNQVITRKTEQIKENTGEKALYVFEEESSDEQDENLMDGMITDDFDDDWEEFSDEEKKPDRKASDDFEILTNEDG